MNPKIRSLCLYYNHNANYKQVFIRRNYMKYTKQYYEYKKHCWNHNS